MTTISIPTAARGKVRAFIKAQPGFEAFCQALGIESRNALNSHLIQFATQANLLPQVQAIITGGSNPTAGVTAKEFAARVNRGRTSAIVHSDVEAGQDFADAMAELKAKEDAADAPVVIGTVHLREEPVVIGAGVADAFDIQPTSHEEANRMPPAKSTEAFSTSTILSSIDHLIGSVVRKEIEVALQPVVDAANKPAVEIERIVEVAGQPVAPEGAAPYALKTGAKVTIEKLFGKKTSNAFGKMPVTLWNAHGVAPKIDPYYVVDLQNMALLATAAEHETNVWLVGPGGSGKTSMPEQFAAYAGRPYVKIGFTRQTEVGEVVGNTGFRDGKTVWEDGALIAAMRRPGTVILFDELTIAPAGVQAIVQAVTDDHRSYTIHATGEVVRAAPGVVFVVADNTNGTGDETGQYAGTNQSNAALVNRFKRMIRVDYMPRQQEVEALMNWTNITEKAAGHVVDFFSRARKLPDMEGAVMSLRQMTGFVNTVKDGFPSKLAFTVAILNKLPSTERAAVEALATLEWNQAFETLMNGSPTAVEPSNAPSDSRAASAFDDEVSASLNR